MKKTKMLVTLAVMFTMTLGMSNKVFAKTAAYVIKNTKTNKIYQYNLKELQSAFLDFDEKENQGSLYQDFVSKGQENGIYALYDDSGKYVSYKDITNAFLLADEEGTTFNLNEFIKKNEALETPEYVYKRKINEQNIVNELNLIKGGIRKDFENEEIEEDIKITGNNITIVNAKFKGDLILDPGKDGSVTLKNVQANNIKVLSGKEKGIKFDDVTSKVVEIKADSTATIEVKGKTDLGKILGKAEDKAVVKVADNTSRSSRSHHRPTIVDKGYTLDDNGNVTVTKSGVTLANMDINNLVISESVGDGDVYLNGVHVSGTTTIKGGGEHSIHFKDSVLATVIVNKNDGKIRIVVEGSSKVTEVQLESPAKLEEDENLTNEGFEDITVTDSVQTVGDLKVQLVGRFETVNSRAANVKIKLGEDGNESEDGKAQGADIGNIVLAAVAAVTNANVDDINIDTLHVVGEAGGSSISVEPENAVIDIHDGTNSIEIAGQQCNESYSKAEDTEIKGIKQATMTYINLEMSNLKFDVTEDDFKVEAKLGDEVYTLQNVKYDSKHSRLTFSPVVLTDNIGKKLTVTISPAEDTSKVKGEVQTAELEVSTGFSGRITDVTYAGIPDLTIKFKKIGENGQPVDEVVGTAVTDEYGYYSVKLPAGQYIGEFSAPGFVTTHMYADAPSDWFNTEQNETAIRSAGTGEIKVVLTWGEQPHDVDSHLVGPTPDENGQFHIYFGDKVYSHEDERYDDIDWDDTDSYGPETTTMYKLIDGEYKFFAYNYSGDKPLRQSLAKVQVYKGNSTNADYTYTVPVGEGNEAFWNVFEIKVSNNGEDIEITRVNKVVSLRAKVFVNEQEAVIGDNGIITVETGDKLSIVSDVPGTKIRYTTDGTYLNDYDYYGYMQTQNGVLYTEPIEVNGNVLLNTRAYMDGTHEDSIRNVMILTEEGKEAFDKITAASKDDNMEALTLDDYEIAGLSGVTEQNKDSISSVIKDYIKSMDDVSCEQLWKIQEIINTKQDELKLEPIKNAAKTGDWSNITFDTFIEAGVSLKDLELTQENFERLKIAIEDMVQQYPEGDLYKDDISKIVYRLEEEDILKAMNVAAKTGEWEQNGIYFEEFDRIGIYIEFENLSQLEEALENWSKANPDEDFTRDNIDDIVQELFLPPYFTEIGVSRSTTSGAIDINVQLNEQGTVYYVVSPDASYIPSVDEVLNPDSIQEVKVTTSGAISITDINTDTTETVKGLNLGEFYSIYITAKDNNGNIAEDILQDNVYIEESIIYTTNAISSNTTPGAIDLYIESREPGTVHYMVLPQGAEEPTLEQILNHTDANDVNVTTSSAITVDALEGKTITVEGLATDGTIKYKVYFVEENERWIKKIENIIAKPEN